MPHTFCSDPTVLCEKLSGVLAQILVDKLKPAISELFTNAEVGKNVSLDLTKLAEVVFPGKVNDAADFVFKYDKNFVSRVDANFKKIGGLNNDIQDLRNKLRVCTRKGENNRKEHTKLKDTLAYLEDEILKFRKVDDNLSIRMSNNNGSGQVGVASATNIEEVHAKDEKITALEQSTALTMCSYMAEMKACVKKLENIVGDVSTKFEDKIENLHEIVDAQNQYGRRNILDLNGVEWSPNENTNEIVIGIFRAMGFHINLRDIDRSHRIFHKGNRKRNAPPVIYVKLINHDLKQLIYNHRDMLRFMPGYQSIYIDENLTAVRRKLFARVRRMRQWESWTNDGKIFLSLKNSEINITEVIETENDLRSFYDTYC